MSPLNITQPLSIWSIMATIRWCPISPKWDSCQPLKKQTENVLEEWRLLIARAVIPGALRPAKGSGRFCRVTGSLAWAKDNHLSTGPEVAQKTPFWVGKTRDLHWGCWYFMALKYGMMLGQVDNYGIIMGYSIYIYIHFIYIYIYIYIHYIYIYTLYIYIHYIYTLYIYIHYIYIYVIYIYILYIYIYVCLEPASHSSWVVTQKRQKNKYFQNGSSMMFSPHL